MKQSTRYNHAPSCERILMFESGEVFGRFSDGGAVILHPNASTASLFHSAGERHTVVVRFATHDWRPQIATLLQLRNMLAGVLCGSASQESESNTHLNRFGRLPIVDSTLLPPTSTFESLESIRYARFATVDHPNQSQFVHVSSPSSSHPPSSSSESSDGASSSAASVSASSPTVVILSMDRRTQLVLAPHGRFFRVRFPAPIASHIRTIQSNSSPSPSPLQSSSPSHALSSSSRSASYHVLSSPIEDERKQLERLTTYTTIEQLHSVTQYPAIWVYPLKLAQRAQAEYVQRHNSSISIAIPALPSSSITSPLASSKTTLTEISVELPTCQHLQDLPLKWPLYAAPLPSQTRSNTEKLFSSMFPESESSSNASLNPRHPEHRYARYLQHQFVRLQTLHSPPRQPLAELHGDGVSSLSNHFVSVLPELHVSNIASPASALNIDPFPASQSAPTLSSTCSSLRICVDWRPDAMFWITPSALKPSSRCESIPSVQVLIHADDSLLSCEDGGKFFCHFFPANILSTTSSNCSLSLSSSSSCSSSTQLESFHQAPQRLIDLLPSFDEISQSCIYASVAVPARFNNTFKNAPSYPLAQLTDFALTLLQHTCSVSPILINTSVNNASQQSAHKHHLQSDHSSPFSSGSPSLTHANNIAEECAVRGIGVFTAFTAGSVSVAFYDRTLLRLSSDFTVAKLLLSDASEIELRIPQDVIQLPVLHTVHRLDNESDEAKHEGGQLDIAAYLHPKNMALYQSYIRPALEFAHWAFQSEDERRAATEHEYSRRAHVQAALDETRRFLALHRLRGHVNPIVQLQSSNCASRGGESSISLAAAQSVADEQKHFDKISDAAENVDPNLPSIKSDSKFIIEPKTPLPPLSVSSSALAARLLERSTQISELLK